MAKLTRLCKHCKKEFVKTKPLQYLCSSVCAIARVKELKKKDFLSGCAKEKKEFYAKHKSATWYINDARVTFQLFIRLRDKNLACISCGSTTSQIWDAGHFYKAEVYTGLIFDERNCHKQCRKCNHFEGGNELHYREDLIARYGVEYVKKIELIKDKLREYKYSKAELIDIKENYKQKIKEGVARSPKGQK